MNALVKTAEFVYDFLADDGWELLVGLAIILPLVYFLQQAQPGWVGGAIMVAAILLTVSISLARKLPKRET